MRTREASRGEAAAWKQLRLLRAEGFAFRREHQVGPYWADFVCLRRRLIVEVDGGVHALPGKREHDLRRDAWLAAEGFKVIRCRDTDILSERNWLGEVRKALLAQPEAPYRGKTAPRTPSPGGRGGRGRGEIVALSADHSDAGAESIERDVGAWWEER